MSLITREVKPLLERLLTPLVDLLASKRVHPNTISLTGFALIGIGSLFLYAGFDLWAVVFLSLGALLDAVDGALARRTGLVSEVGAFLDSTIDRFSDALPFTALAVRFSEEGSSLGVLLSVIALSLSFGVSYTRARAESLGVFGLGGLFERTERWIVLVVFIALGLLEAGLLVVAVGSGITVVQRILETKKALERF